jgi:hypothetical protein
VTLSSSDGFYLYSQGFLQSTPYLREQTQDHSDFSGSVFRIIPQCMHAVQTSLFKFITEIRGADFPEKIVQLMKMEENLEGEIKTNIHLFSSLRGQVVRYNSLIQLEHLTSHKLLTLRSQTSADAEKDNFKISFEDFPSDYSHFRIVPSFNFLKQGSGKVKLFDKVYLEIVVPELRKVAFLHGSKGMGVEIVQPKIGMQGFEPQGQGIEVNVSLDQKTRWMIGIDGDVPKDDRSLLCGDYIWLNAAEENRDLTVYKARWEVEDYELRFAEHLNDTNGLWQIEFEDAFKGGPVQENKRYRLKHIVTGKYLAITHRAKLTSNCSSSTIWCWRNSLR